MRPEAYYEFLRGTHLEGRGQVNEAISAFERAASLDPHAADIPAELAALYARQGNLAGARESAEAALKIDPDNVDAHRVLGGIFASMAESEGERSDRVPQRIPRAWPSIISSAVVVRTAPIRTPGSTSRWPRLYLRLGDNQKAVEVLHRVTEYEPDAGEAYVPARAGRVGAGPSRQGHCRRRTGGRRQSAAPADAGAALRGSEAVVECSQDLRAARRGQSDEPGRQDTDGPRRCCRRMTTRERHTKAKELLTEVTAGAPTEPRPLYLLSMAERKRRDFAAAEAAARRLMTLDPSSATGPFALAQVYEDQRLFGKAADVLAPAVARLDDKDEEGRRDLLALLAHLGFAQLQAGLGTAAVKTFERARALTGSGGSFDTSLIQAYLMARQYDRAADLARAARLRQPDRATVCRARGASARSGRVARTARS